MAKFKKGDRVRLVRGECVRANRDFMNAECVIKSNDEFPDYQVVTPGLRHTCCTSEDNFELVSDHDGKVAPWNSDAYREALFSILVERFSDKVTVGDVLKRMDK